MTGEFGGLEFRHLRSFLAVAQDLNITQAAARLHLTQQSVSGHLQQLERAVGVPLLVRNSRGVKLTPAGEELAAEGGRLAVEISALLERVRVAGGRETELKLGCQPHLTMGLAIELAESLEAVVPHSRVEVVTLSTYPVVMRSVLSGEVDVVLVWAFEHDERLRCEVVGSNRCMVALPSGHPLSGRDSVELAELADEPVIVPAFDMPEEQLAHWLAEPRPGGRPAPRGSATQRMEDNLPLVARGQGIWFAPETISRYYRARGVRWLPVVDGPDFRLTALILRGSAHPLIEPLLACVRGTGCR